MSGLVIFGLVLIFLAVLLGVIDTYLKYRTKQLDIEIKKLMIDQYKREIDELTMEKENLEDRLYLCEESLS